MSDIKIRKFDRNGEIFERPIQQKFTYGPCSPVIHYNNDDEEQVELPKPIISENMNIIQAKADKHGILQRPDNFTGENLNEEIDFKGKPEKKKDINESKTKFIPGERLLLTIKKEKPELLERPEYKSLTINKKDKLRKLLDRLN